MSSQEHPGAINRALRAHTGFRFLALALGFAFQIAVVKLLPPEHFVTYAILLATLMVLERLLSFGIDRTILRFVPTFKAAKDVGAMWFVATRLGAARAAGLVLFGIAWTLVSMRQFAITPSELSTTSTFAFAVWFCTYTLLKDAESLAQSLIAHRWAAIVAAIEGLLRLVMLALIYYYLPYLLLGAETVIVLCAVATSVALGVLLFGLRLSLRSGSAAMARPVSDLVRPATDARRSVLMFSVAAYASTLSYLISSPGAIRLVARTGLDVVALAAFSFVQGFSLSLQRALPGMLILPSIEPIAVQMTHRNEKVLASLSLLFKIELTCALTLMIVTSIDGAHIVSLISRSEYSTYYYILPILLVAVVLSTMYRVLEILGSMSLKFRVFLMLWPLSIASVATIYFTIDRWGLVSVLLVPLAEQLIRVSILMFAFRRHGVRDALDPRRSSLLVGSAVLVISAALLLTGPHSQMVGNTLPLALGAAGIFLVVTFITRPLSVLECEIASKALPGSWEVVRCIARRLSRP